MKKLLFILSIFSFLQIVRAQNVGIGTVAPNASAQLDVNSTTKGFLPPRMTMAQRDSIMNPLEGLMIYNITSKKPNYYDGSVWKNFDGSFANEIGDNFKGGKIAYIFQNGDPGYIAGETHGLIAATSDQGSALWGCAGTTIAGADGIAVGTGKQNTIDIVAGCPTAGIAARVCDDLVLNGFSDWYLPSRNEMNLLYINRGLLGGFEGNFYWTSTEVSNVKAWFQRFDLGIQVEAEKGTNSLRIRPVRYF